MRQIGASCAKKIQKSFGRTGSLHRLLAAHLEVEPGWAARARPSSSASSSNSCSPERIEDEDEGRERGRGHPAAPSGRVRFHAYSYKQPSRTFLSRNRKIFFCRQKATCTGARGRPGPTRKPVSRERAVGTTKHTKHTKKEGPAAARRLAERASRGVPACGACLLCRHRQASAGRGRVALAFVDFVVRPAGFRRNRIARGVAPLARRKKGRAVPWVIPFRLSPDSSRDAGSVFTLEPLGSVGGCRSPACRAFDLGQWSLSSTRLGEHV